MAVTIDAVNTGTSGTGVASLSWTHTPVGTPTAVGVWLGGYANTSPFGAATYGGTTMSAGTEFEGGGNPNSGCAKSFGLASPASGAQTVVVNAASGAGYMSALSITVTGSDTTTCFSNRSGNTGTSVGSSASVTSAAGELVVDVVAGFQASGAASGPGGSQTSRKTDFWNGNLSLGASTQPGSAGTVTSTWSSVVPNTSQNWGAAIDSFKAGAGGGGPTFTAGTLPIMGVG